MKNNYARFKTIVLISFILLLYAITIQASAGNTPSCMGMKSLQQEIKGIVTDQEWTPLAGVAVYVKGESNGVVTNQNGEYSIRAAAGDTLVFSYLGFKPVEIIPGQRRELNVQMEEGISSLSEVEINAGYYNTTRRESTGNISRVTAEEIELQPVVSPIQALQGRMAGVEIIPGGSHPGMAPTIRIRGRNSLREDGNLPLYIIDGVPINSTPIESNSLLGNAGIDPLNTLNLSNIESIEVLKDADATAIYGSRGANGVVLITTKRGRAGKTSLEARVYKGVATLSNRLDLLDSEEYLQIRRQAFENDGVVPIATNAYDLVLWDQNRYTDWQDFLFGGTAENMNASLSISGGNELTTFRLGGSFFSQGTIYPGEYDYNKVTGDFNLNHSSRDQKFTLSLSSNYGVDINDLVSNMSLNSSAFLLPPNAPSIFNEDGTLNWNDWGEVGLNNPFAGYYNSTRTRSNNLITNLVLAYELVKGLKVRTSMGYTFYNSDELWKRPGRSYNPSNSETNNSFHLHSNRKSWIVEPQLVYDDQFGSFNLEAIIGATFQENSSSQMRLQGSGYASEVLIGNLAAAEQVINASTLNVNYRYSALFSRIGLDWNKKYFLNLTGRRDGSSRFGPNNRFANFGAVGAAWIFSEENAVANALSFLSFGKLRGSYGTTGNDQIGDYGYLDAYEATPGPGGLYPTQLANPDYSWEVNKKMEAAVELGFLKDRMNLMFSWYRNRSSNQLVGYPLPATTGFTTVQANLPATVQNTGWELEMSSIIVSNQDFQWETSFNLTFPRNELISYPGLEQSSFANTYRLGHPLNISLRYQYAGLDPESGLYTIMDINNDGRYDYEDRVFIQDENRNFFGGVSNSFSFKNISLQFLWEFVKQEGNLVMFNAGRPENLTSQAFEALQEGIQYQRISQQAQASTAYSYALNSNLPIEDASFLRLKTLSLGYSIPASISQKIGVESLRLFIHGQNLVTITPYSGLDPEFPYSGLAFGGLKTITGGLQLNL